MPSNDHDRPLVGEHPYAAAAREHKHPSPVGDAQAVGDLDRLQLAEGAMADALVAGVTRLGASADGLSSMAAAHRAHIAEIAALIRDLGGAPAEHGIVELPRSASEIERLAPDAITDALVDDARALAQLYRHALDHVDENGPAYATLAGYLTAAQLDADRLARLASNL